MKKILFFIFFTMSVLIFSENKITLNIQSVDDFKIPQETVSVGAQNLAKLTNEGLFRGVKNGKPVLGIVKTWNVSENGLKWTFVLKDNLKWANGDNLTAEDVKRGILKGLEPKGGYETGYLLHIIKNAEKYNNRKLNSSQVGIKVIDAKTIEIELEHAAPYLPDILSRPISFPLHKDYLKGRNYNGMYVINSYGNSVIKLEKNNNYWNKNNVKVDKIDILDEEDAAVITKFRQGKIDVSSISSNYRNEKNVNVYSYPDVWYLMPNMKNKFLNNTKIRRALQVAINRNSLGVDNISKAETFVPKNVGITGISRDFSSEVTTKVPDYNPAEAKRLLGEGLKELGISKAPSLNLIYNNSGINKILAEKIKNDIKNNLGIDIKLVEATFKERLTRTMNGSFDLTLAGWGGDYKDPLTYLELFETGGKNNHGKYSNKEYDRLLANARTAQNGTVRTNNFKEIEKIISQDLPVLPLYQRKSYYLINPRLKNSGIINIDNFYSEILVNSY